MLDLTALNSPKAFGQVVGMTDRAMARLGLWACQQAADGSQGFDDAVDILQDFNEARRKSSGDPRIQIVPHKVQVSKLGRLLLAGETFGDAAVSMLEAFSELHMKKFILMPYGTGVTYNGEYNGMVEVAREALRRGKVITRKEITELVTVQ
jgi:hypothetical protein